MLWLRKSRFFPIQPLSFFVTSIARTNLKRFLLNILCHRLPWQPAQGNVEERHVEPCYMVINFPLIPFICYERKFPFSIFFHGEIFWSPQQPCFGLDRTFLRISCIWKVRESIACKFQEMFCDVLAELCRYHAVTILFSIG